MNRKVIIIAFSNKHCGLSGELLESASGHVWVVDV